ncbi:Twinfilin-1 [Coemansia interrupta]|uniref:Twinfilin-1 n=1 Tax=Coemansia interrupta TaxID=1126814 RepID=A0A9W8HKE4_9FUNG|nr:Twinfilin-1 [Coemansia interrupta]
MAHQSGISVSDSLAAVFVDALTSNSVRAIKVSISGESLEASATQPIEGDFAHDFSQIVNLLEAAEPCYLLVRHDADSSDDDTLKSKWLLCTYVPDAAPVRAKMLHASTKASLTKALGESYFVDDIFGTTADEFSLDGYRQHRRHVESGAPLTEREQEMQRIKELESSAAETPTMDSRRTHVSGAKMNMSDEVVQALGDYASGSVNFILLEFDFTDERFVLGRKGSLQAHEELASSLPENEPRYALYWYDSATSVFIYSCPTASNVRNRMVYSASKYGFLVTAQKMGVRFDAKLEIDNPRVDLSAEALSEEVSSRTAPTAPNAHITQPKFKRPAPPSRRPRTNN